MPSEHLPREVFLARPTGRRPLGRPRNTWRDFIYTLVWELPELAHIDMEREVRGF